MIDFNEITKIASRYADMYISNADEFCAAYDEAVRQSMYTPAEWNAIGMLLDPYYNCKIGKLSRQDTIATQNEVQRVYEQDILRSKICPSRTA